MEMEREREMRMRGRDRERCEQEGERDRWREVTKKGKHNTTVPLHTCNPGLLDNAGLS